MLSLDDAYVLVKVKPINCREIVPYAFRFQVRSIFGVYKLKKPKVEKPLNDLLLIAGKICYIHYRYHVSAGVR